MKTSGKKFFAKKQVVTSLLVLMLAAAIYINWRYADPNGGFTSNSTSSNPKTGQAEFVATDKVTIDTDYFEKARKEREKAYADAISEFEEIEKSAKAGDEEKAKAYKAHIELVERQSKQSDIESLIKAKGFSECVVVLSEGNASIVVYAKELSNSEILQIQDIVTSNYEVDLENIKIINIK